MKQADFDRAFSKTPDIFHESILEAFEKGERAMRFRNKILTLCSAAAVLAVVIAVAALAAAEMGAPRQDTVLSSSCTLAPAARPSAVYYTEKGNYFHTIPDCSGMQGASAHDLPDAFSSGKGACPVCVDLDEILPWATPAATAEPTRMPNRAADGSTSVFPAYPTAQPTPAPTLEPVRAGSNVVFCTENGTYYHVIHDCSGMQNARTSTIDQAEAGGKLPCPVCLSTLASAWFSTPTPMPMPVAADREISNETGVFRALFGMDYAEAFPGYAAISSMESLPAADSNGEVRHSSCRFTNGRDSVALALAPAQEDQNGTLSISMDDGAAAVRLMENAPEPLRTIYMKLAPDLIENILAVAGKNTTKTHRLGDVFLTYSYEMDVIIAEFCYFMNDGSIIHLGWKTSETEPRLYYMQWAE